MDGNQFIIKVVKATGEGETEDLVRLLAKVATDIHLLEPRPRFSCLLSCPLLPVLVSVCSAAAGLSRDVRL